MQFKLLALFLIGLPMCMQGMWKYIKTLANHEKEQAIQRRSIFKTDTSTLEDLITFFENKAEILSKIEKKELIDQITPLFKKVLTKITNERTLQENSVICNRFLAFYILLKNDSFEISRPLQEMILETFTELLEKNEISCNLLADLFGNFFRFSHPPIKDQFLKTIFEYSANADKYSDLLFQMLYLKFCKQTIKELIPLINNPIENLELIIKKECGELIIALLSLEMISREDLGNKCIDIITQPLRHSRKIDPFFISHWNNNKALLTNHHNFFTVFKPYLQSTELGQAAQNILAKKHELNQDGYYTFVHGQKSAYLFPEMVFTHLWQIFNKRALSDFLFLHVRDLSPFTHSHLDINEILNQNSWEYGRSVLFMNYSLFANTKMLGSNSAYYAAENVNCSAVKLPIAQTFNLFGISHVYNQFKKELEELAREYSNAQFGNIMLVAVPKKDINKYVYCADGAARSKPIAIAGGGGTTDTQLIMETLLHHPEKMQDTDALEFCLVMNAKDGGLDPDSGIKIIPFITCQTADREKRTQNLFAKIKDAIEHEEKEKKQNQSLRRAATLLDHLRLC